MMATRTGRPPVENPKTVKYSIRLDVETERRLVAYCERAGITKGEAFRRGVGLLLTGGGEHSAILKGGE